MPVGQTRKTPWSGRAVTFDNTRLVSKVWPSQCLNRRQNQVGIDLAAGDIGHTWLGLGPT